MNITKRCSTCKKILPRSEFYPHKRMRSGLQPACRTCSRQWHRDRPEYVKEKNRKWREKNPHYSRDWQRKNYYGVRPEQVSEMRLLQENRCAGCLVFFDGNVKECVDHCHKTKKVRGLLCNTCNQLLGHIKDDIKVLMRLALYLKSNE